MIKQRIPVFFLQAALYGSCLFVWGCGNDNSTINAWTGNRTMVDEVRAVTSLFSQNGRMKAKLTAPLMLRSYTDTVTTEFPNSLHVDFYDSLHHIESYLDARYGRYYESLNKVLLRNDVRVVNTKGDTLSTAELWWDQNARIFYTDSTVRIIQKDKRIRGGKGMEATQDLNTVTIRYPTGTVMMSDSGF